MADFSSYVLVHVKGTRWVLVDQQGRTLARLIIDIQPPLSGSLAGSGIPSA